VWAQFMDFALGMEVLGKLLRGHAVRPAKSHWKNWTRK
jgi:hypothetical protein